MRILSAWTDDYWPLAKITMPAKIEWAGRWGFHVAIARHLEKHRISWERPEHWLEALDGAGWLFFSACDVALTNTSIDPATLIDENYDLIIPIDGNGLQSDSFFMRECGPCLKLLTNLLTWSNIGTHEQDCMAFILAGVPHPGQRVEPDPHGPFPLWNHIPECVIKQTGWAPTPGQIEAFKKYMNQTDVRVKIVPLKTMHAYPTECGCPPELGAWQPGDFMVHAVAQELDFRVQLLSKILREHGR